MRPLHTLASGLLIALLITLAGCGAPVAPPAPTASPPPSAAVPGNPTAAPPTSAPGAAEPTPAQPQVESPLSTAAPAATPEAPRGPLATIGYGRARAAAFLPGGERLAVATEAGLLLLDLPDLTARSFVPVAGGGREIAISPDGALVAIVQDRGPAQTGTLVGPLEGELRLDLPGFGPVFSPDGRWLALSEREIESGRSSTRLYRLPEGTHAATMIGEAARFSPDGRLVGTTFNGELLISRLDGTELLRRPGFDVAFSPDGATVALAGQEGVAVYPLRDGLPDLEAPLLSAPGWATAAEFGPGGQLYALVGAQLQTWDPAAGAEVAERLQIDGDPQVGPGAQLLAVERYIADAPGELQILRLADRQELYADEGPRGGQAAFSPEGPLAAVITLDGELTLVSAAQGVVTVRPFPGYDRVTLGVDGARAALGSPGQAELWLTGDVAPELRLAEESQPNVPRQVSFDTLRAINLVGERLVAEVERFGFGTGVASFDALAWELASGAPEGTLRSQPPLTAGSYGFSEMGQPVAWDFDPASGRMAWRDSDGAIYLDEGAAESAAPVAGELGDVRAIALAPGGGRLALGSAAGELLILDTAGRGPLMRGPLGEGRAIVALAWSGDGSWLALRLENGEVRVQEVVDDDPPARFAGAPFDAELPSGGGLALSADGARLAVGGFEGAAVYRRADGAELLRVPGAVDDLALSADGSTLALLRDGRAELWSVGE